MTFQKSIKKAIDELQNNDFKQQLCMCVRPLIILYRGNREVNARISPLRTTLEDIMIYLRQWLDYMVSTLMQSGGLSL